MSVDYGKKIWMNGSFHNWEDCQIHVMSHVIHYGSSVFEGIRCYRSDGNSVIFRLREHMQRLLESARIYRMGLSVNLDELCRIAKDLVRENQMKDCYIRPIIYRGYGAFGLLPHDSPLELVMACWSWGTYLGKDGLEKGIDAKISTWNRIGPNTLPGMAKAGGNYLNSQLMKMEAVGDGYAEGIALDTQGFLAEGSGENLFLVKHGCLHTPCQGSSILSGITRQAVIALAEDKGLLVQERKIPREAIYTADEVFMTGTAAEITPIRSVDKIQIGSGSVGPVTKDLQKTFFGIIKGEISDQWNWLTPVY